LLPSLSSRQLLFHLFAWRVHIGGLVVWMTTRDQLEKDDCDISFPFLP
jgi:hypothetical protein